MARFCMRCGTENGSESKFCINCGANLATGAMPGQAPAGRPGQENRGPLPGNSRQTTGNMGTEDGRNNNRREVYNAPGRQKAAKKPLNKKILIGIAAAAAAAVVVIILFLNAGKTINLKDYAEISCSGTNGYASASVNIDYERLEMDALKAMGYKTEDFAALGMGAADAGNTDISDMLSSAMGMLGKYPNLMQDVQTIEKVMSSIETTLNKTEGIYNGDKLEAAVEYYGQPVGKINIVNGELSMDVSGLKEVQPIDPFEGVNVVFSGVDTYGIATVTGTQSGEEKGINYVLDKDSGLKIGDKVTLSVTYDKNTLGQNGYELTNVSREYTVDKLQDIETIDLFANVKPEYSGIAPYAKASINSWGSIDLGEPPASAADDYYSGELDIEYSIDSPEDLDIGDQVTVTASYDREKLEKFGKSAESDTKIFTVTESDVPQQMWNPSTIDAELMEDMQKECRDHLAAYFARIRNDNFEHSNEEYIGPYFLKNKHNAENMLYLLYQGNVSFTDDDSVRSGDVIYAFRFKNLIQGTDGKQSFEDGPDMVNASNSEFNVDAYLSLEDAYNDLVASNMADYESYGNPEAKPGNGITKTETKKKTTPAPTQAPTAAPTPAPTQAPTQTPTQEAEAMVSLPYGLQAPASDFIIPDSSERYITTDEINSLCQSSDNSYKQYMSQMLINEIYARHGYTFHPEDHPGSRSSQESYDKFESKAWYKEAQSRCGDQNVDDLLNDIERSNRDLINTWQKANVTS